MVLHPPYGRSAASDQHGGGPPNKGPPPPPPQTDYYGPSSGTYLATTPPQPTSGGSSGPLVVNGKVGPLGPSEAATGLYSHMATVLPRIPTWQRQEIAIIVLSSFTTVATIITGSLKK